MTDPSDAAAAAEVGVDEAVTRVDEALTRVDEAVTRQVRASSAPLRQTSTFAPAEAAAVTAELPAQRPPTPTFARRPVEHVRPRRQPAPAPLQILVWLLALIFLIVAVGAIVALASPSALSFLRNSGPAALHVVSSIAG
jgi:hypothetical protein